MPRFGRRQVVDHLAVDLQRPGGDVLEPGDEAEKGRLAAARRADEDDELAGLDVEIDALDDVDRAEGLLDPRQLKLGHFLSPPSCRRTEEGVAGGEADGTRRLELAGKSVPGKAQTFMDAGGTKRAGARPRLNRQTRRSPPASRAKASTSAARRAKAMAPAAQRRMGAAEGDEAAIVREHRAGVAGLAIDGVGDVLAA